jgi:hypothetical protein
MTSISLASPLEVDPSHPFGSYFNNYNLALTKNKTSSVQPSTLKSTRRSAEEERQLVTTRNNTTVLKLKQSAGTKGK